jgi:lysophospholipase L1-like esterase
VGRKILHRLTSASQSACERDTTIRVCTFDDAARNTGFVSLKKLLLGIALTVMPVAAHAQSCPTGFPSVVWMCFNNPFGTSAQQTDVVLGFRPSSGVINTNNGVGPMTVAQIGNAITGANLAVGLGYVPVAPNPQTGLVTGTTGNATALPYWRAAVARVRAGIGRAKLLVIGDSTTMGAGAGTGGNTGLAGAYPKSWVQDLSKLLSNFVSSSSNSILSDQNSPQLYTSYDSRVSFGTGWAATTNTTLGGNLFQYTTGATGTLSFTPTASINTITIYYVQQSGAGTFNTNVDGGSSLGTTNAAGASFLTSVTYTVTAGTHTVNIIGNNAGNISIVGVLTYNTATPAVDFIQAGYFGGLAVTFVGTTNVWSPQNVESYLAPDLTIIDLTINDSNNGTTLAAYQTNIQSIITTAKSTGDCILMVGPPSNSPQATNGTLASFVQVLYTLGATNNCLVVNTLYRWNSYAATNPLMPYYDSNHPTAPGYYDLAQEVYEVLSAP